MSHACHITVRPLYCEDWISWKNKWICMRNDFIHVYCLRCTVATDIIFQFFVQYLFKIQWRKFFSCYSSFHNKSILSLVTGNVPFPRESKNPGRHLMVASYHSFYLFIIILFQVSSFSHIYPENKGKMHLNLPILTFWLIFPTFFFFVLNGNNYL